MVIRTLLLTCATVVIFGRLAAQKPSGNGGVITGNVLEEAGGKAVAAATIELLCPAEPGKGRSTVTNGNGEFVFSNLDMGIYQLRISSVGFNTLSIDSIRLRPDRNDFSLNDLRLTARSTEMTAAVVYAEKPLVQSKNGNITFNAAESPLSAGSSANELLKNVPLVSTDADGNLTVRGKQPKVLIDEKPVNLNARQLQDFLDALPGNMIERIEVMTNPPPQYANEEGGVINIVTRKGKIGIGGRFSVYGGTRGEAGAGFNGNYRDKRLVVNLSGGLGYNEFTGDGWSKRQNIYPDSTNFLNTTSNYTNRNTRPNGRLSVDYDLDKNDFVNVVAQINNNDFRNRNFTEYTNINGAGNVYQISDRNKLSTGHNVNPKVSFTYRHKGNEPGEDFQVIASYDYSSNLIHRDFNQPYFYPDHRPTGVDSTQAQDNNSWIKGYNIRADYNKPLIGQKTFLYLGSFYNYSGNLVDVSTRFLNKADSSWITSDLLSSHLRFTQTITDFKGSLRQVFGSGFSLTAGTALERTGVAFDLYSLKKDTANHYWNWLPFANFNKTWESQWSVTLVYRRTIRRPGIGELNPSVDYSDPYNIRSGNPGLQASTAHNFDFYLGKNSDKFYLNYGLGFNKVQDIFSQIQTLLPGGVTLTTFQNISHRDEYSTSTWAGYTFSRQFRVNLGASFNYNVYSDFDHVTRNYHDGGSLYSNFNLTYTPTRLWNITGSCLLNRYANPQGASSSYVSMNMGIQRKFFDRRFIVTLNITDPFVQQHSLSHTYGTDFYLESYGSTQSRNFRLTLSYDLHRVIDAGRNKLLRAGHQAS
ncbi:outer membrane beta-barrel protein [Flavitalea sp. BT771]|uniref:outer membrane beta-barrel protein n=1 Tax=Flavitalea sp. BT771 TaxID=3063329 RepID=UPI0026E1B116|nr:outer membrane beta-barrel protein [Flavitalea sp. BT771]MDO6435597.1 outer membrane beta-barrel protein [Flavitalea sp. BT771]MDV6224497.1 outer membrane beta-barrel protein [Flavitalea sp. BT771]